VIIDNHPAGSERCSEVVPAPLRNRLCRGKVAYGVSTEERETVIEIQGLDPAKRAAWTHPERMLTPPCRHKAIAR
jgi:hypothetical protein